MALDVLNVVELGRQRVVDVDDDDLPVGLALVEQSHDAEDLDLLDLASVANRLANLANIERIVIALGFGLGVSRRWVLPGLLALELALYVSETLMQDLLEGRRRSSKYL